MALLASRLVLAMKAKVAVKNPDYNAAIGVEMDWLFEAIAEAVVEEIVTNATVTTVTTTPGVTSGPTTAAGTGSGGVL